MHTIRGAALAALITALLILPVLGPSAVAAQEATPAAQYSCGAATAASPMAGMSGMAMATPPARDEHGMAGQNVEFDQLYIDMMLPHHASIIALAQAARDRLTDPRLVAIADNIITSQEGENAELRGFREEWYGSPKPMPMDAAMMHTMMAQMPGMGDMHSMQLLMDPRALVAAFCRGEDPDLTFIDLAIPHHEMAIHASEAALDQATHEELRKVAQSVIQAQQQEVNELEAIRAELTGEGTPTGSS